MPIPMQFNEDKKDRRVVKLTSVATEEEILEFCNRVREAGGADVLEELLPSRRASPQTCLIATSLNFGCSIVPGAMIDPDSEYEDCEWWMRLPADLTDSRLEAIAEAVGSQIEESIDGWKVKLPLEIGNAAYAFDMGAFSKYVLKATNAASDS